MVSPRLREEVFRHMISLSGCDCVYASTQEVQSGRTHCYLIFNEGDRKIYSRNGLMDSWEEVRDQNAYTRVREAFSKAMEAQTVPNYGARWR